MAKKNLYQLTVNGDKKISVKTADIPVNDILCYLMDGISLCLAETKVNHGEEVSNNFLEGVRKNICSENFKKIIEGHTAVYEKANEEAAASEGEK